MSAMSAVATRPAAQVRPARKPVARSIRVLSPGRVVITVGRESDEYTVTEFPAGGAFDGRAFRCEKFGGEAYGVFLSRSGQDDICECRGFQRWSRCKHRDGLRCLLSRGKL